MRGVTLDAKVRNTERAVGCTILTYHDSDGRPAYFKAVKENDVQAEIATEYVGPGKDGPETALRHLHSAIYRVNGKIAYERQNGMCCFCGKLMPSNAFEVDHINGRGRGRSDRVEHLRACCTGFNGCDGHRKRHGG